MFTLEQLQQDIQDLPEEAQSLLIDFIEILKKRYPKQTLKNQSQEKSLYEKFDEIGFIGCVSTEENLSTTYKQVFSEGLNAKYNLNTYRWKQAYPFDNLLIKYLSIRHLRKRCKGERPFAPTKVFG